MALESPLRPFPTNNWSVFSLIFSMSFSVLAEETCTSHLPLANTPKSVMKFLRLHRNDGYFLSAIYSLPRCASCLISRRVCRMKCLLFFCSLLVKYIFHAHPRPTRWASWGLQKSRTNPVISTFITFWPGPKNLCDITCDVLLRKEAMIRRYLTYACICNC